MNGAAGAAHSYKAAPFPAPRTLWREAAYAVVDLEMTGFDPGEHEIVSFAAVPVAEGRVKPGDVTTTLVRPRHMPGPETIRIHGLREADLRDAPPLNEALEVMLEAITGRVLVAHYAAIETGFLSTAFETRGLKLRNPVIDTAGLAAAPRRSLLDRILRRPPPRVELGQLARTLGLPVHRPHTADGDALTTAQVFIALATHLEARKPQTVGSLARFRP